MANLSESATYDAGVYQIETTDPVSGGATGIANKPLINLANRTTYLKSKVDAIIAGTETLSGYAKLASPTFTGNPAAPTPALGDDDTSLATTAFVQDTVGGVLSKSVAGGVNVTLTAVEAGNGILILTGAITANISVIVPTSPTRSWVVRNSTTGAFTITVKTAAGTGVVITQGKAEFIYTDGTNVVTAHDDYADMALTGVPTAPTATAGTNTTQLATTAFVKSAVDGVTAGGIVTSVAGRTGAVTLAVADVSGAAPAASPALTGTPTAPTAAANTNTTQLATTAFVLGQASSATPAADGTAAAGTATTFARGDHVHPTDSTRAPLASPTFTGTPSAPTAALGTNTTQLATTAFVKSAVDNTSPFPSGTRLMFAQAAAPTGWTQVTTDEATNRMLRVVNTAGAGTGGSHSPILNNVVPAHTHGFTTGGQSADHSHAGNTNGQSGSHNHSILTADIFNPGSAFITNDGGGDFVASSDNIMNGQNAWLRSGRYFTDPASADHYHGFGTGGVSANHTHSGTTDNGSSQTNWTPRYIDLILCSRN